MRGVRHTPEEARREITDSAARFLSQHPFRDLTIATLMAGTTLSRPAFYQYFKDLHHLLESLLGEVEAIMGEETDPWVRGEGEPIAALRISLRGIVQAAVDRGPILRAVAEAAPLDEGLEAAWTAFMRRRDDAVSARIATQQAEGLVRAGNPRRLAEALNAMDAAVLIAEFGKHPQGNPGAALDTLHSIWVGALYGPAAPKARPGAFPPERSRGSFPGGSASGES